MSSPLAAMSVAAIALAGVAFFLTEDTAREAEQAALAAAPDQVAPQVTFEARAVKPTVRRNTIYVSVFNNSNVTGLAGETASRISTAGWQVVGTDNWYGTIPATTIYYPPRLRGAAEVLSKDIGITRVEPAVDPMSMDRLTVILTSDFG